MKTSLFLMVCGAFVIMGANCGFIQSTSCEYKGTNYVSGQVVDVTSVPECYECRCSSIDGSDVIYCSNLHCPWHRNFDG